MGQGGRGNFTCSTIHSFTPSVFDNRIGEFNVKPEVMATGHSRSSSCDSSASSSAGYIEHTVSRFDTLAGVAIKYGVEVADIKRMNGLLTDFQMFALKTLKIPLPGRHPPSSSPNSPGVLAKELPPRLGKYPNSMLAQILKDSSSPKEPEKRPVTSAMGLLRGYYGLSTTARQGDGGTEMTVYKSDSDYHSEDEPFSPLRAQETSNVRYLNNDSLDLPRKSPGQFIDSYNFKVDGNQSAGKSKLTSPFEPFTKPSRSTPLRLDGAGESGGGIETDRANDRFCRRRAKGEGLVSDSSLDFLISPEIGATDRVNVPLGKSSALRQKIPVTMEQETESSLPRPAVNSPLNGWHTTSSDSTGLTGSAARALGTSILGGKTVEGFMSKIRRSGSTSSLQDDRKSYKGDSGTLMASQGSSQSGVISSVLEGFPKPGATRRNKAALD